MPGSNKRIKVALFHFNPIELYPPVLNMIEFMTQHSDRLEFKVFTLKPPGDKSAWIPTEHGNVQVVRFRNFTGSHILLRYIGYVMFCMYSFFDCLFWSPGRLFYIESSSAPVPLFLKRYFFPKRDLYIHYHEYMSPADYRRTSLMWQIYRMENKMYGRAAWISHTNEQRMSLFQGDVNIETISNYRIMPNFPSGLWAGENTRRSISKSPHLRLIYVGAIDLKNMYFPEVISWLSRVERSYTLDVLSNQDTQELLTFLDEHRCQNVRILPGVSYFDLPAILKDYDVGLILYKSYSDNFRFNAPNKLFEYLACGLDVWFPTTMDGVWPYKRLDKHPMVIPVDYAQFSSIVETVHISRINEDFKPTQYFCESVYIELLESISQCK